MLFLNRSPKQATGLNIRVCLLSIVLGALALSEPARAQYQRSIINTGFESNNPSGNPGFQFLDDTVVPGWLSTTDTIELWDSGFLGVTSFSGNVHAEMNARAPGSLFQELCLVNGDVFNWTFAHRARSGGQQTQNVTFEIADNGGTTIQVLGSQASTVPQGWNLNSASNVIYTGPSGIQRVQFSTTDPGSVGNFLDGITIRLNPFLEFDGVTASGDEASVSADLPSIVVSGDVATAFDVVVNVTGGTATLGDDFTTPNGTATFNVNVPVGNYVQTLVPLGISIVDDSDVESTETIELSITPVPADYTVSSNTTCALGGQATSTYSITDNDARVTLNKQWVGAVVGDDATITASNGGLVIDTFDSDAGGANELDSDSTPTIAVFGDTLDFAETLAGGNTANYQPSLSCSGAADTDLSNGLTIGAGESAISCTYTNTRSNLSFAKTVEVVSDGVNLTNPKAIPGAVIRYCILTTNVGQTTAELISAVDPIPSDVTYVSGSMLSGTSCAGAVTPEDDNNAGADEADPFGMSISGTTVSGIAATLLPGGTFAMIFEAVVN